MSEVCSGEQTFVQLRTGLKQKDSPTHYENPAPPPSSARTWVLVWVAGRYLSSADMCDGLCCLTSTEARRPIRDGDEWKKGDRRVKTSKQAPTRKTKAVVDRRQNNRMLIKAVSVRHCLPSVDVKQHESKKTGIAQRPPHHTVAAPTVMQNIVTKNVRSSAVGKLTCLL